MRAKYGTFKSNKILQKLWSNINTRCYKEYASGYRYYGGKGIKNYLTPENLFFLWERDGAHLLFQPSLDRIDSNDHYTLENCRFIEMQENRCRGKNKLLEPHDCLKAKYPPKDIHKIMQGVILNRYGKKVII